VINERPHKNLGALLASLARKRHAHDHYAIAEHLKNSVGYEVGPDMLQRYLYGAHFPEPEFFRAFAKAFSLTVEERRDLAWLYCYGYTPS
jgi:hypothetical protein